RRQHASTCSYTVATSLCFFHATATPEIYTLSLHDALPILAGWMETFAQRGGQLVIHGVAVGDLDYFSRAYDLVLVSAGKGELVQMFGRDAGRSPYSEPQRALAVAYVHGLAPRPEHADTEAV